MDHVGPHVTRPGPVTPDNCSRNVVLDVDSTSECVDEMVTDDPETKRPVVKCATVEVKSEVTNGKHVFRKAIKPLDLNLEETKPLISSINGISRPKSIVKTPSVQSFGVPAAKSPSKNDSFQNYPKGIVKSDSGEDKPVLRVQFHNGVAISSPPQSPIPDSEIPASPCGSLSSSSSGSSDDSIGNFSEARPPDGGWGWVVVIASFMVNLIADGITFSFSVLYVEFLDYFGEGKAKTAWIGSLFMAMPLLSGPIASFLTDRYGCRRVCIAGSILASVGFIISSFAESMMVVIITFGVIAGFGLSLCYVAAVVIVAYYFDKRRSFATGLSVCGSGIGTFIFAPVIDFLIVEYGWRGTVLILAGMFLNMAVCGALMRDLAWTTNRAKAKAKDRKRARKEQRNKNNGSSGDSFTASNSTNTAGTASQLQPLAELDHMDDNNAADESRLFSSLVNLPTFVRNGEKVPLEVLELLSTHRNVYNVLLQNYPSLLISSRSFSDSGRLNEQTPVSHRFTPAQSPLAQEPAQSTVPAASPTCNTDAAYLWWLKKTQPNPQERSTHHSHRRLQTAYLKDLRIHRHSLTYRGAMLNINRYRLRASSCPDIYRNSMTTIAKEKYNWYDGLWEFWDLLVDMLDFSHFSDPRFLLFALSNFLLYLWYDMPYVFFTDNAKEMGFTQTDGSLLISVIGIFNMVGEIFLGWAGDCAWVNARGVYALCMLLCGITMALVPLLSTYMALCILSGAFGLFIAANYSLTSIILVELITLERFTNAYGLLLLVQGVANLVGPPLAGWIYDITLTYDLSFYLAGFFIAMSGAVLIIIPAMGRFKRHLVRLRNCSESTSPSHRSGSPTPAPPSGSPEKEVTFIRLPPNDNCNGNGRILNCFSSEEDLRHVKDPGINV